MTGLARIAVAAALAVLAAVPAAGGAGAARPDVAALQAALRVKGLYTETVDGLAGNRTVAAVRAFQRQSGLRVTGRLDPPTRVRLGLLGRPVAGARVTSRGMVGWDVSVLEFLLARRGFDPGRIDGRYDDDTAAAVRGFQRHAALGVDGTAGPATFRALRDAAEAQVSVALAWPIRGKLLRRFGLEGDRLNPGIDLAAPYAAAIAAPADGRVVAAGFERSGLGLVVRLDHGGGVSTTFGHLARVDVRRGQTIVRGALIGLVGWTGKASKPALHLQVRVRGAAVDPLAVLH